MVLAPPTHRRCSLCEKKIKCVFAANVNAVVAKLLVVCDMTFSWPTLEEYARYEDAVITSLGLHSGSFLPANAMEERHASFRRRYTDEGAGGGLPASATTAREALMEMLAEQHDVFVKYYKCMQAKTKPSKPAHAQTTSSVNDVLHQLKVLHALTPEEMTSMQQICVKHLKEKCSVDASSTPNEVQAASSLCCMDYRFAKALENEVKEAATLHCLAILQQRPSIPPASSTKTPLPTSSRVDYNAGSAESEHTDRIRIGDVIDDVAEDYPSIDWFDRDVEGDIKMKVGMMMSSQERRKRFKRKRDELGARIYEEKDREHIKVCIGKAVNLYLNKKK